MNRASGLAESSKGISSLPKERGNDPLTDSGVSEERFRPPDNNPPGTSFAGGVASFLRKVFDLQVASVLQGLAPWLSGISGNVLEVGCGAQPYRHLIAASCRYQGLDWEEAGIRFGYTSPDTIYYQGGDFPLKSGTFENVFHTEVLEHIYRKELFLRECRRVLKPGGEMFFSVPFQARYHYIPHDYWRFTPAALERMLREAGFGEIDIIPRGNDITVAAYKIISVIYRWIKSGFFAKLLGIIAAPLLFPALLIGHISLRLDIGSPDDCLGYLVRAR
ncbi:MAG: class I SAM-dependent methyltransferase [Thermodesulfovibrionales bacterium]